MLLAMQHCDLKNKKVIIREDFNVPMQGNIIQNDSRIKAAIPTIQYAIDAGAAVILLSHLGRPQPNNAYQYEYSLEPIAERLANYLHQPVRFVKNWLDEISIKPGEVVLCENVRFNIGEKENNPLLAKKMAALGDIFVMDAFATAHRAEASTVGIVQFAKVACAGPLLIKELKAIKKALLYPQKPVVAIIGGAKTSTKLKTLESLLFIVDYLIPGGGIANTLLAALDFPIGSSLYEPNLLSQAKRFMQAATEKGVHVLLPTDVTTAESCTKDAIPTIKHILQVSSKDQILDIGPETIQKYTSIIQKAGTLIWNGPIGVFEYPSFEKGTKAIAEAIASSYAFSIAGGGETIAAIDQYQLNSQISYISTGGGAFLAYLEGSSLPALKILEERNSN